MSRTPFNWDDFFSKASFTEICKLSPDLSYRRHPSTYSPDRSAFYLSSLEYDVETGNQNDLRDAFIEVKRKYAKASMPGRIDHADAHVCRIDFVELCGLLARLSYEPEEYADPDALLLEI